MRGALEAALGAAARELPGRYDFPTIMRFEVDAEHRAIIQQAASRCGLSWYHHGGGAGTPVLCVVVPTAREVFQFGLATGQLAADAVLPAGEAPSRAIRLRDEEGGL